MRKTVGFALLATLAPVTPALASEEGGGGGLLTVDGGLMIWTLVVFGLLFVVLKKYAWPQILGAVEAREKKLESQIAETARLQEEAKRLVEQNQKVLADGRVQSTALLAEAKTQSERERAAAVEKTKAEQDELLARARREIAAERDRAIGELRSEAVDLSLAAASKLVGERLDSEADRKLVTSYLNSLGEKH
ncbi:MAG: F0F1 ATP synthase subunit B [Rhizobacter sp.]